MRRGAGYSSNNDNKPNLIPVPNLPGLSLPENMFPKAKAQTLRFVSGYPIAEPTQTLADPLNRAYNWGGRPPEVGPVPPYALHEDLNPKPHDVQPARRPGSDRPAGNRPASEQPPMSDRPAGWRPPSSQAPWALQPSEQPAVSRPPSSQPPWAVQPSEQPAGSRPPSVRPAWSGPGSVHMPASRPVSVQAPPSVQGPASAFGSVQAVAGSRPQSGQESSFAFGSVQAVAGSRPPSNQLAPAGRQEGSARHPELASTSGRQGGVPNWIAYNGLVLRFLGYFREEVPNSPIETWRLRRVQFRYYLENDQVEIMELWEPNSGMPQGILLKRHCAVKADGMPLRWPDLRIGGDVTLYARTYSLVCCDAFTRSWYAERGQGQPPDEAMPEGPYDVRRKYLEATQSRPNPLPARPAPPPPSFNGAPLTDVDEEDVRRTSPRGPNAIFETFPSRQVPAIEARDSAVLRFMCAWDNTSNIFGEVLAFQLHYYVRDGSVEIREVLGRNSGRDPFPLLLSRRRLPKTIPPVYGRPMSPRSRAAHGIEYYTWRDLRLGRTINMYGRSLLLYDCDDATRAWVREHAPEVPEEELQTVPVDFHPFDPKRPPLIIPPHVSGIGSEEDSLQSVLHLVPRPPPKPYTDYLENWNKVLRFEAGLVPLAGPGGRPQQMEADDGERRFIVSFFILDRTLAVWESRRNNSGREGGVFLERTRVPDPETGQAFTENDMQVGAVLQVYGRGFQLLDADAYTLQYMEREAAAAPGRFPWADPSRVLARLSDWVAMYAEQLPDRLRAELLAADRDGSGYIDKFRLYALLSGLGSDLGPHEVVTLVRQLGADRQGLLVEQLLVALGLAPPPPPQDVQPQGDQAEEPQPAAPPQPSVPFPASDLAHRRRVAWAPRPGQSLLRPRTGPPSDYIGPGPVPGHPRVPTPPVLQPQQQYQQQQRLGTPQDQQKPKLYNWQGQEQGQGQGQGQGDDRRQRDTPEKLAWEAAVKGTWRPTAVGAAQPKSLWQTSYSAAGGIGHAASFRRQQ